MVYLTCLATKHNNEPPKYIFSKFENNQDYKQIQLNTEYDYELSKFKFGRLFGIVKKPISYLDRFSRKKNKNYCDSRQEICITKISPKTYFEGINYVNIVFKNVHFDSDCFHRCTFRNCTFINITTKKLQGIGIPAYDQGFSACEFMNCSFKSCRFEDTFFSMGALFDVTFFDTTFRYSLIQRMTFSRVVFEGNCSLEHTDILSPSGMFDIAFFEGNGKIKTDTSSHVGYFKYNDFVNIDYDNIWSYRIWRKSHYEKVADTYYAIEQLWASNFIKQKEWSKANFYYQRKKAETRSKRFPRNIPGYLAEWIIGYGEAPFRAILTMLFLVVAFSFIYINTGFDLSPHHLTICYNWQSISKPIMQIVNDWLQSLYFSFFTLISVGQGSIAPNSGATQIVTSIELFFGMILGTLFTGTLFRKYTK